MSPFQVFAEYGQRAMRERERKKRNRGMTDMFPEVAADEDPTGDERYTTRETLEWCKGAADIEGFDLDVAACVESHWAPRFYSKADDGLSQPWDAERIWCNPPYSDIEPWVEKAWSEWRYSEKIRAIAMLIPATRTEQRWWQNLVEVERDCGGDLTTHFMPGRTSFARPGSGGVGQSGSPFGCVLLVWRRR